MAKIKRFGILSMATFMGLYGIAIGLIAAILGGILGGIFSKYFGSSLDLTSIGFSWISLLTLPLFYGIFMFVAALIFTPIINLILKLIHGLDVEIK